MEDKVLNITEGIKSDGTEFTEIEVVDPSYDDHNGSTDEVCVVDEGGSKTNVFGVATAVVGCVTLGVLAFKGAKKAGKWILGKAGYEIVKTDLEEMIIDSDEVEVVTGDEGSDSSVDEFVENRKNNSKK